MILNNHPLTLFGGDLDELDVLTPAHFLTGGPVFQPHDLALLMIIWTISHIGAWYKDCVTAFGLAGVVRTSTHFKKE